MDVPDRDEPAHRTGGTDPDRDRLGGLPVSGALGAGATSTTSSTASGAGPCEACGSPQARHWSTGDGPARLCPPCATLHGIGCP